MNTFIFDGSWNQIKGVLRQKFAQLTDADLEFIQGKGEELFGRLETKLGLNRAELEQMLEDIKASVSMAAGAAYEKIGQVKSKVSETAGQWRDKAGDMYEEGRKKMGSFRECGEEQVRRNPREAIITALAAGFVIGLLLRRI